MLTLIFDSFVTEVSDVGPVVGVSGTDAKTMLTGEDPAEPAALVAVILNLNVAPVGCSFENISGVSGGYPGYIFRFFNKIFSENISGYPGSKLVKV